MAFFGSYVFHAMLIYPLVHRLSGFRCSASNGRTAAGLAVLIAAVFAAFQFLPLGWAALLGILATVGSGLYSVRTLLGVVGACRAQEWIRRALAGVATTHLAGK
jgi:PST family polysaccharide transporter